MWVYQRAFLTKLANRMATPGGSDSVPLSAMKLGLLKMPVAPTVDMVWGDVSASVADFAGYGDQTVGVTTSPFIGPGGLSYIEGPLHTFTPANTSLPNTIYAGFLRGVGTDSLTLYGVEVLDDPVPLPGPDFQLTYVPRFGFDPAANWGLSLVSP